MRARDGYELLRATHDAAPRAKPENHPHDDRKTTSAIQFDNAAPPFTMSDALNGISRMRIVHIAPGSTTASNRDSARGPLLRSSYPRLIACLFLGAVILMQFPVTARADFLEGWDAYRRGDYAVALQQWSRLAEEGDPVSQYNVGVMYDEGTGVEPDPAKVVDWWGKAAAQGHPMAQHNLALLLIERGGEQNLRQAAGWLTSAAEAGFIPSQYSLAKIYASGIGVERDDVRALALFEKAGEAGFVKAQYNLGKIYRDGIGVEADPAVSFEWFNKAARQGYAKAQERLATRFALGDGVGKDVTEALKWAILATRQGYASAQDILDDLRKTMSTQQIAEAERRAAAFRTVSAAQP